MRHLRCGRRSPSVSALPWASLSILGDRRPGRRVPRRARRAARELRCRPPGLARPVDGPPFCYNLGRGYYHWNYGRCDNTAAPAARSKCSVSTRRRCRWQLPRLPPPATLSKSFARMRTSPPSCGEQVTPSGASVQAERLSPGPMHLLLLSPSAEFAMGSMTRTPVFL